MVANQDAGYEINKKDNDRCCGKNTYIQRILVPTVPTMDKIIGIMAYPIPRMAPGSKSIMPQRK